MIEIIRTPDERFANLPGYAFEPHYVEVGKFTQGWTDFELKDGNVMPIMGIFVSPPLHPAPHLVSFHADMSIRLRMCDQT